MVLLRSGLRVVDFTSIDESFRSLDAEVGIRRFAVNVPDTTSGLLYPKRGISDTCAVNGRGATEAARGFGGHSLSKLISGKPKCI